MDLNQKNRKKTEKNFWKKVRNFRPKFFFEKICRGGKLKFVCTLGVQISDFSYIARLGGEGARCFQSLEKNVKFVRKSPKVKLVEKTHFLQQYSISM